MAYTQVPVAGFKGLNLAASPADVGLGGLVDGVNFDVRDQGRLQCRRGSGHYINQASIGGLWRFGRYITASTGNIGGGSGATYCADAIANTVVPIGDWSYGMASSGLAGYVYSCNATRGLKRTLLPAAFGSALASTPSGTLLATMPLSDRLVIAGQPGDPSKVSFSDPGDGTTWGTNNYVRLNPGDGQQITALVVWETLLFVFKESKFYVFAAESTAADGTPIFNYRAIDTGVGCAYSGAACASPDGIYFVSDRGVYLTDGGPPQPVSAAIAPLFDPDRVSDSGLDRIDPTQGATITFHNQRIHVGFHTPIQLVLNPRTGDWAVWRMEDNVIMLLGDAPTSANFTQLIIAVPGVVLAMQPGMTTDNGTAITWNAYSGSSDLGLDSDKTIREFDVQGTGTISVAVLTERDYDAPAWRSVTLTPPTGAKTATQRVRRASRGSLLSWAAQGTGPFELEQLTWHVRERRAEGTAA